jgi:integration host factor subunit beta
MARQSRSNLLLEGPRAWLPANGATWTPTSSGRPSIKIIRDSIIKEAGMTKSGLIENLSSERGVPINKAERQVNRVFPLMSNALAKGERVEIRSFGSFKIKHYDGYTGVNPKTLGSVEVEPEKFPFFKCGLELKRRLNSQKI